MILTVGNTKGGTGKSTLAINLAIDRAKAHSVLLVDGDEQRSFLSFTELRGRNDYTSVALTGISLRQQVPSLAKNYQEVIMRRKVYSDSIANGLWMMEMKPRNGKAILEFQQVVSKLYAGDIQ